MQPQTPNMKLEWREAYCPAHFGNSYEAMWPREMAAYLDEIKHWGFNRYSDWMTTTDVSDPYNSDATWNLAMELFARKKAALAHATKIGLKTNLILTPNHVFLDQLRPELLAKTGKRIFGQLICPSIPEARAIILRNFDNIFRDLSQSGVQLDAFTAFAYDYGGCDCDKCAPWILTFAKLTAEIHDTARKYFPSIEPLMCAWWWKPEEYRQVSDWATQERPNWLKGLVFHIPYDDTDLHAAGEVSVPDGCQVLGFVHGGYSDARSSNDIYAKFGPVLAPHRLPETLGNLAGKNAAGFQLYSEGVFDDVNKAILGALSSGKAQSADEVLREYAARYFSANAQDAVAWAKWLSPWAHRERVDLDAASRELEVLAVRAKPGWRLEHWQSKLKLEALDRALAEGGTNWDAPRLALADQFWAQQENLQRGIYSLGPTRHIFSAKVSPPVWFESWQQTVSQAVQNQAQLPGEA